ncbi:hypothetical protein [Sulfitobacter sp. R18_1]|uniref:hypothetical protein n=1 Tax=Sulfitobacter sp. R18_1 TaxID=2821104 RepID=UPI001ADD0153|nr:hypothetical protein [Sulfitobacter sp. R18_1]MBO9428291.1 hypothetical protein [Sulfitobacter sp. R18_1]
MSNAKLITNTTEDIKAFAEKVANSDRPLSKHEILNMYADATQGPKTVWGGITNAKKPVVSQRASELLKRSSEAPVATVEGSLIDGVPVKLVDEWYEGKYSLNVKVSASDTGIAIKTDNGQEVVVEYYNDKFSVRMYNDLAESPVSVHSQPGHAISFDASDYHAGKLPATIGAPAAGSKKGRIIGYQVSDTRDGKMYADKPENLVLTYNDAQSLLDAAYENDHQNFMMVAVHEGEIQEPVFLETFVVVECLDKEAFDERDLIDQGYDLYAETSKFSVYVRVPTSVSIETFDKLTVNGISAAREYARKIGRKHQAEHLVEDIGVTCRVEKL